MHSSSGRTLPSRALRALLLALLISLVTAVLFGLPAPAAADPGSAAAKPTSVPVGKTVATRTVKAKGHSTITLVDVPTTARTATVTLTVTNAARATRISVCSGTKITASCKASVVVTGLKGHTEYGTTEVDLAKASRRITLYSSSGKARIAVDLNYYSVPPGRPRTTPASRSRSPSPCTPVT